MPSKASRVRLRRTAGWRPRTLRVRLGATDGNVTEVSGPDVKPGLEVIVGGGLGRTPMVGMVVRDFLPIKDLMPSVEAVLSVYIFGQFRFPAKVPSMLALGTILVLVSILLLTIAEYFRRRGIARTGGKDTGGFL